MEKRNFNLLDDARKHIQIVAHRGVSGGNIPCNTLAAYEIALKQGADMIEVDVSMNRDGTLYIFHPNMEQAQLCSTSRIPALNNAETDALRYVNTDNTPTQFGLARLDEVFETFKGRCYINVDKFWNHPVEIAEAIHRHNIAEQVVVKSALNARVLEVLEYVAPSLMFMPVAWDTLPEHEMLMTRKIRYIGAEVLFHTEQSEVCSDTFIKRMHRDGKLVWVNAIIYDHKVQLAAGHSDDTALTVSEADGWGWLAEKGFDLIQTDWPLMLRNYLCATGQYERMGGTAWT